MSKPPKKARILLLMLLLLVFSISCEKPDPPVLNNPLDPNSELYIPRPPMLYAYPVSQNIILLSWVLKSLGEKGFKVERKSPETANYEEIGIVPAQETEYLDTSSVLVPGGRYWYRVRPFTDKRNGPYSNEVAVTI